MKFYFAHKKNTALALKILMKITGIKNFICKSHTEFNTNRKIIVEDI